MTSSRFRLALCACALFLPFSAAAHTTTAENINLSYRNASTQEVEITFTNPDAALNAAVINVCAAKDTLPANWDTQPLLKLRTSSMCEEDPHWSTAGGKSGKKFSNVGEGAFTDGAVGPGFEPGRYIVYVNLFMTGHVYHHSAGHHPKVKLVELSLPEDSDN